MTTITVKTIKDYCDAVYNASMQFINTGIWWRGLSNSDWKLIPSLFHMNKECDERHMLLGFRKQATIRHDMVPSLDNFSDWMFLMQHYGLPTRLLDWTRSPLIALHFALSDDKQSGDDASVWCLNPAMLNFHNYAKKERSLATAQHPEVVALIIEAFTTTSKHDQNKSLAISTVHTDLRQMIQMSECTIHGSRTPLEDYASADEYLVKIFIPSECKQHLKERLFLFGISEYNLFPDLEHLAKEMRFATFG